MNFVINGFCHDNDEFNYLTKGGNRMKEQIVRIWECDHTGSPEVEKIKT